VELLCKSLIITPIKSRNKIFNLKKQALIWQPSCRETLVSHVVIRERFNARSLAKDYYRWNRNVHAVLRYTYITVTKWRS